MKYQSSSQLFTKGFFYVFGLSNNPLKEILQHRKSINDFDRIKKDWENVGKDIETAYEKERTNRTTK